MKVLVTSRSFASGSLDLVETLSRLGYVVTRGQADHDPSALAVDLADAVAWIAGTGPVTAEHLAMAPSLKVIARYGVGVDAVDLVAAEQRGIVVTNTPGANSDAVAEHAIALLLCAARQIVVGDRQVRQGDWRVLRGREIGAMTVGIWGFGRIGQRVARLLSGFGASVLACDPFLDARRAEALGVTPCSAEELASRCDAVSLNAPGGFLLVDDQWLRGVRPGLLLVNAARADLVDEPAVVAALRDGRLGSYAADTLAGEVGSHDSPLLASDLADRVTITPHLGAQTMEAVDAMGRIAVENALAVLEARPPANPVISKS